MGKGAPMVKMGASIGHQYLGFMPWFDLYRSGFGLGLPRLSGIPNYEMRMARSAL